MGQVLHAALLLGVPQEVFQHVVDKGARLGGVKARPFPRLGFQAVLHEVGEVAALDGVHLGRRQAHFVSVQGVHRPSAQAPTGVLPRQTHPTSAQVPLRFLLQSVQEGVVPVPPRPLQGRQGYHGTGGAVRVGDGQFWQQTLDLFHKASRVGGSAPLGAGPADEQLLMRQRQPFVEEHLLSI